MTFREFLASEQGTAVTVTGYRAGGRASQSPVKPEMGITKLPRLTLPTNRIQLRKPFRRI